MNTQDADPPAQPMGWDRNHLATALAIAARHTQAAARRLRLSRVDRDDLRQDILLALLERSARFDPQRGSWAAFVTVLARRTVIDRARRPARPECLSLDTTAGQRLVETAPSVEDNRHAVEFGIAADDVPDEPRALLAGIIHHADLTEARDSCGASPATFYRQLGELRCWLRVVGIAPPWPATAGRVICSREKNVAPNP